MKVKIIEKRNIKDTSGNLYCLFKVQLNDHVIWVSEADFTKDAFPKEKDGYLILQEPVNETYKITIKKNRKDLFLITNIVPETQSSKEDKWQESKLNTLESTDEFSEKNKSNIAPGEDNSFSIVNEDIANDIKEEDLDKVEKPNKERASLLNQMGTAKMITDQELIKQIINENQGKTQVPKNIISKKIRPQSTKKPHEAKPFEKKSSPDKIAFITKLIELSIQKRTDERTRERLIKLIGDEVSRSGISREDVEMIVEEKLGIIKGDTAIEKKHKTLEHKPKNMVKFLQQFSKDEKLKWFTHDPDIVSENFNLQEYKKNAETQLRKFEEINYYTYSNIRNFLFDTGYDCYGNNGLLKYTWKDAMEWSLENPGKHPYFARIKGESFSEYIHQFKNIIEFRTDNPDLFFYNRVKFEVVKLLGIDFLNRKLESNSFKETGVSLSTYIDTNMFFRGLKQILTWIHQNKAKSNEVVLSLADADEYYVFEILHKNSYFSIDPNSEKLNGLQGDFEKTRKFLFCVVDWIIKADFRVNDKTKKTFEINCLDTNTSLTVKGKDSFFPNPTTVKEINEIIEGVKHILKIYKPVNL
jgi:hypothetical protein